MKTSPIVGDSRNLERHLDCTQHDDVSIGQHLLALYTHTVQFGAVGATQIT
jgi:hypothetical protein